MIERTVTSIFRITRSFITDLVIPVSVTLVRDVAWPTIRWADRTLLELPMPRMTRRRFLAVLLAGTVTGFWAGRECEVQSARGRQRLETTILTPTSIPTQTSTPIPTLPPIYK